jgi:hypothetical protein
LLCFLLVDWSLLLLNSPTWMSFEQPSDLWNFGHGVHLDFTVKCPMGWPHLSFAVLVCFCCYNKIF